jgi:gluconokinase
VLSDGLADPLVIAEIVDTVVNAAIMSLRRVGVRHIRGIGFTSFAMNIFGVDKSGDPATPCYTYASHQSSSHATEIEMKERFGRADHIRTGAVIHSSYASVQLKALLDDSLTKDPDLLKNVYQWQTLVSYIISKWTGQVTEAISLSEASWMGLLDFRTCRWDDKMIQFIGLDESTLPRLRDVDEPTLRGLSGKYKDMWPEAADSPIFPAVGDGAAACLGSGCYNPSRISITVGTCCAVRVVLPLPRESFHDDTIVGGAGIQYPSAPPEGLFCYRINKNKVVIGGALTDGGALFQWLERLIGLEAMGKARKDLEVVYDAQDIVTLESFPISLPFFSGERATGYHSSATGTIHGITRATTSVSLLYSLLEAVSFRARVIVNKILTSGLTNGLPGPYLVTSGKGLRYSRTWRQMIADMTGLPVVVLKHPGESTSLGVARLVVAAFERDPLVKASIFGSIVYDGNDGGKDKDKTEANIFERIAHGLRVHASEIVDVSLPQPQMVGFYEKRFSRHTKLYENVVEQDI